MKIVILGVFLIFSRFSIASTGSGYQICPSVSTGYFADKRIDRTIIVNYEASSDHLIFLRCGQEQDQRLTSRGRQNSCHVYRSISTSDLCEKEKRSSKVSDFLGKFIQGLITAGALGGIDTYTVIENLVGSIRNTNMDPECIGTGLMKNIAINQNIEPSLAAYYEAIAEIAPFTGLVRLLNDNNEMGKNKFIFDTIDRLLIGGNGSRRIPASSSNQDSEKVHLKGPAYMVSRRNRNQTSVLVNQEMQAELCGQFPNIVSVPE